MRIVLINPNNPTGAVYSRELLEEIARIAEENQIVVFSDEIYDQMLYGDAEHIPMATLVHDTLMRHVQRAVKNLPGLWLPGRVDCV